MDKATISVKQGSERNFGIVFSVVFLFFSFYPNFSYEKIRLWSLVVSVLFFLISIFQPSILKSLNFLWFKFGILLGRIISPIIMALVFVFAIIPMDGHPNAKGAELIYRSSVNEILDLLKKHSL